MYSDFSKFSLISVLECRVAEFFFAGSSFEGKKFHFKKGKKDPWWKFRREQEYFEIKICSLLTLLLFIHSSGEKKKFDAEPEILRTRLASGFHRILMMLTSVT